MQALLPGSRRAPAGEAALSPGLGCDHSRDLQACRIALTRAHNGKLKTHKGVRMTRKLKTLGVALFAVLALTAVAASAASAASYTASSYPTTGTGESEVGNDV